MNPVSTPSVSLRRPAWLPSYLPELNGLRGLAILGVVLYHANPLLIGTPVHYATLWGWSGVIIFFSMSGFLITCNLLQVRNEKKYFHNFHARRALRIWPLYILVILICYWQSHWFIGTDSWPAIKAAPWLAYLFFVQNLFPLWLPSCLGPTWALAIEEQYYFFWAPLVRWLRRPWQLALLLVAIVAGSPWLRHVHPHWLTPTHTLIHLDGIALGSLVAIGFCTLGLGRRVWLSIGLAALALGIGLAATFAGGSCFLDSALALGYTGAMVALIASTGARNPIHWLLSHGPLAYYGKISYGLYLTHIMAFIFFGWVDIAMASRGLEGRLITLAVRLVASTLFATGLWYGVESKILKLKRHF